MREFSEWLASLSPEALAAILVSRPDAVSPPRPRSVPELADRLRGAHSLTAALLALPRPALQLAEAIQALGSGCHLTDLAAAMGLSPEDPDLADTAQTLGAMGLAWTDGVRVIAVPMDHVSPDPLQLGRPVGALLADRPANELRLLASTLGVTAGRLKRELIADLAIWLADGDNVRDLVQSAPAATRELLTDAAWSGPAVRRAPLFYGSPEYRGPERWALDRGLLSGGRWGGQLEIPLEVALALRGPEYRVPFDPAPPSVPLTEVRPEDADREAAAAGTAAVRHVTALLEDCARTPIALLKTGGVGTRELRRLAKSTGESAEDIRFWLEVAAAAGLAEETADGVMPADSAGGWLASSPAERLASLLEGWRGLWCAPLYQSPEGEPAGPALRWPADGGIVADLRDALVAAVDSFPPGRAAVGAQAVIPYLIWHRPLLADQLDDPAALGAALWRESELMGVIVRGAPSSLAGALLSGDGTALAAVAAELLPAAETRARFQADLTAVVSGTPSAALAGLLDSAADPEARGVASTWRFSPASVRRALDAGHPAADLLGELRAVAGRDLPQPLEYLVADVARRHGAVRAREVACCLRSDDTALLAEILASRACAKLGLSALAPTVLGSAQGLAETLRTLRAAGYAPVAETGDAVPIVERVPRHRAPSAARQDRPRVRHEDGEPPDPVALATEILDGRDYEPEDPGGTVARLRHSAPQLTAGELRLLAHAIDEAAPVHIEYRNAQGSTSNRIIEQLDFDGHRIYAWCTLRDDERVFSPSRIGSVAPV
ncbi:MAG: hypothetical protein QOD41_1344 [Cryptosporangiaceae bacterium]|nr:hypothetical protein [Cryptosporangiaceae bacterium]